MRDVALPKCRIEQLPQVVLPIKQAKRQSTAGEVILKKPELELRGVWEQVPGVQALHTTEQEELPIGRPKAGRCSGALETHLETQGRTAVSLFQKARWWKVLGLVFLPGIFNELDKSNTCNFLEKSAL